MNGPKANDGPKREPQSVETIELVRREELDQALEEIQRLRQENDRLARELESARRSQKRQAAPFSKGEPKATPKKPGRKSGAAHGPHHRRRVPEMTGERYVAELSGQCECGGAIGWEQTKRQYQEDIVRRTVVREFQVQTGHCGGCGRYHQGRHALQTSDALDAAQVQVGPEAIALLAHLNKRMGLSLGHAVEVLRIGYQLEMSRGGAYRALARLARKAAPTYEALGVAVKQSPVVWIDETGWKVGGRLHWLWVAVGRQVTVYRIEDGRGFEQAAQLVGTGFAGCLIHDGWIVYWQFVQALHQSCLQHLLRRCQIMIETSGNRAAAQLPAQVKGLLEQGLELRDRRTRGEISERGVWSAGGRLAAEMERLLSRPWKNAANRRLEKHLRRQQPYLFTFLHCPGVEATNNRAERAIRPAVIARKVWGGSRTANGAQVQQVLASVLATCRQQAKDAFSRITDLLRSPVAVVLDLRPGPGSP